MVMCVFTCRACRCACVRTPSGACAHNARACGAGARERVSWRRRLPRLTGPHACMYVCVAQQLRILISLHVLYVCMCGRHTTYLLCGYYNNSRVCPFFACCCCSCMLLLLLLLCPPACLSRCCCCCCCFAGTAADFHAPVFDSWPLVHPQ